MNSYILSRQWFSYAYENPKIKPVHTALYFWIVERANVSGWKKIVDIQTERSMECLGITDWRTYKNALQVLADSGFVIWIEKSKNQYTCNRVSLVENAAELSEAFKNSNPDNVKATAQNAEAIAEAIAEAYAEADVKAIAEALQSYINLQTYKPSNPQTPTTTKKEEGDVYYKFIYLFNKICKGRDYKGICPVTKEQFDYLHYHKNFTYDDFKTAISNGFKDSLTWTKPITFTPEYITRESNFIKYLNWIEEYDPAAELKKAEKPFTMDDYIEMFGGKPEEQPNEAA